MSTPSARFKVNGAAVSQFVQVTASTTLALALESTQGVSPAIEWTCIGTHSSGVAKPTITKGGFPSGVTASMAIASGAGQSYLLECKLDQGVNELGQPDPGRVFRVLVYVPAANDAVLFAFGETNERGPNAYVDALNIAISGASGGGGGGSVSFVDIGTLGSARYQIHSNAVDGDTDPDYVQDQWVRTFVCPVDITVAKVGFYAVPPGVSSHSWSPYTTTNGGGVAGGDGYVEGTLCKFQIISHDRTTQLAISTAASAVVGWNEISLVTPVALSKGVTYRLRFACSESLDIVGVYSSASGGVDEMSTKIYSQRVTGVATWQTFATLLEPGEVASPGVGALELAYIYNVDPYFRLIV